LRNLGPVNFSFYLFIYLCIYLFICLFVYLFIYLLGEPHPGPIQYFNSKLFNVLFAKEYARRSPHPITIFSANPGYTESQLGAKDPATGVSKELAAPHMAKKRYGEG
jgi:hypothetical protein